MEGFLDSQLDEEGKKVGYALRSENHETMICEWNLLLPASAGEACGSQ